MPAFGSFDVLPTAWADAVAVSETTAKIVAETSLEINILLCLEASWPPNDAPTMCADVLLKSADFGSPARETFGRGVPPIGPWFSRV